MPRYKYTGNHLFRRGDDDIEPGEVVELSESSVQGHEREFELVEEEQEPSDGADGDSGGSEEEEGDSPSDDAEADSEPADEPSADSEAEAPFDPSEFTIEQLEAELEAGDFSQEELAKLYSAEVEGDDRSGALDAIDNHLE